MSVLEYVNFEQSIILRKPGYLSVLLSAWISSYNGGRSTCINIPSRCSYSVYPGNVVRLLALLAVRAKLRASAKGFGSANGFE